MIKHSVESGFSAVELLITLFIAVAFLTTGYQLYTIVIKSSGDARMRSVASNIAYDNMRRYSAQATNPCTVVTPSPTPSLGSNSGLSNAAITVTFSCPFGTSSPTSKVQVSITYGSPQQEVVHAIYVSN
jgi:Tfp pilus assembly protein PilV